MFSDEKKRLLLPAQSYRLCLIAGVQPAKASVILEDVSGGMPQRFVWTLCSDRYAPDLVGESGQRSVVRAFEDPPEDEISMKVCKRARMEIDDFAVRSLRGEFDGDPIYGHLLQSRLKVAACLAILHNEPSVTDEWWGLADWVVSQSENARAVCNYYSYQEHKKSVDRRARDQATIAVSVASGLESSYRARCRDIILRRLEKGSASRTKLAQSISKSDVREHMDSVLEEMVSSGSVIAEPRSNRKNATLIYRLP
jgi:hypothetical protein